MLDGVRAEEPRGQHAQDCAPLLGHSLTTLSISLGVLGRKKGMPTGATVTSVSLNHTNLTGQRLDQAQGECASGTVHLVA